MSRIIIIGGGITGLTAAWELQQHGIDYILLEGSNRLGGKIVTERTDGFIIEAGADSFLTQKPWAWQLCRDIGLGDRLIPTNEIQRNVYIYHNEQLQLFPRGMRLIVPVDPDGLLESALLTEEGKHRMLAEVDIPARAETGDESLATFVERRFGHEALQIFGESLLSGIHVANPANLSIAAAFPNYVQLEHNYGSVTRGMREAPAQPRDPDAPSTAFVSLRNGMYELIEGLQAKLTGDVRIGQSVTQIDPDSTLHLSTGEKLQGDALIITTPAQTTRQIIASSFSALAKAMMPLKTASSGTVSLGYRREDVEHPLDGTGFVIPHSEGTRILACTWNSTKLAGRAPDGYVLMRVFVGGYEREQDVALSDEELVALARNDLKKIMNIDAEPVISRVFRWREANPQYEVGHLDRMAQISALCPPWLTLAGSPYNGIGIPDCVRQGREAARHVMTTLGQTEKPQ
jgi:oxygen-dependent protoporphyrinogen oxidase